MSIDLSGKYIPMEYFREYIGAVRPDELHKITPSGEEVKSKDFPFRMILDRLSNVYFIPIIQIEGSDGKMVYDLAYSLNNIIEAASGDKAKQIMIDKCHNKLKVAYRNYHVMEDNFQQAFYETAKSTFEEDYEEVFGKKPKLPEQITTHRNISASMINLLISEAKTTKQPKE